MFLTHFPLQDELQADSGFESQDSQPAEAVGAEEPAASGSSAPRGAVRWPEGDKGTYYYELEGPEVDCVEVRFSAGCLWVAVCSVGDPEVDFVEVRLSAVCV